MLYNKQIFQRCFYYPKRYWYKNIKCIPWYFTRIRHLVKYGYDVCAPWNINDWFIDTMRSILQRYRENYCGVPVVIDNYPTDNSDDIESQKLRALNDQKWDEIIDRMIKLLDLMDEENPEYAVEYCQFDLGVWKRNKDEMNEAKDEFFKLFSKYFWCLWD